MRRLPLIVIGCFLLLIGTLNASACGTTPTGLTILSCAPLNIINTQSSPTSSGFQQLVQNFPFNGLVGNFVVYNSVSGALVPAWIESSNTIWLNLGANTIPADGSANGIYQFGFGSSSAFFLGNQIGEAPQLTASYGEYDNGNTVFPFYENWAGSSTPTNYGGFDVGSCVTQNNEVVLSLGSSSCYVSTKVLWPATSANIVDVYADIAPSNPGAIGAGYASCAIGTGSSCGTNTGSTQEGAFMGAISGCSICGILSEQGPLASTSSAVSTANQWTVYSTQWESSSSAAYLTNYGTPLSISGASGTSTTAPIGYVSQGSGAGTITSYWIRLRTAPPNGVMPSVVVGNSIPNGVSIQSWKASINPVLVGEQETLTANLLAGTPPYTYNFLVYNAVGDLVLSQAYTSSLTVNSLAYSQNSAWGTGTFTANIAVTDSASSLAAASLTYTVTAPSSLSCTSSVFRYAFISSSVYENPGSSENTLIVTGIASGNESFYLGSSSSRPLIASLDGGGHNESYPLTVPPGNYFAVDFSTTPLFTVQCLTSLTNSNSTSKNSIFLNPSFHYIIMIGDLLYIVAIALFFIRLTKLQESNYMWAIVLFMSGTFIWFGYYFSIFPFQSVNSNTLILSSTNSTIETLKQTIYYPIVNYDSYEFMAISLFTGFWSLITILLGIAEALEVWHNDIKNAIPRNA